jgi:PilZ domain
MPNTGSGIWYMPFEKSDFSAPHEAADSNGTRQEVRCAVRFPLTLPVVVETESGDVAAQTKNVSANGVLFELDRDLSVGVGIHFDLRMPRTVLGTPHDVLVHCSGRVVRCSISHNQHFAAATIDEYRFAEQ